LGAIILYFAAVLLVFRTPKTSYWLDDPTYGNARYFHFAAGKDAWNASLPIDPPQASGAAYRLAIVELDEYGDFFQSQSDTNRPESYQLDCAKEMLLDASAAENKPVLLLLFIHGWRHDASPEDDNLVGFKQLLGYIAQSEWGTNLFSVCGVYVGWRGASIRTRGLLTCLPEGLSFWSRKSVAEKIASTPASSALFGLTDVARLASPDPTGRPASIVLAGHSLGAGILMNSVSQAFAYEYAKASSLARSARQDSPVLESPVNLILLLNPAFESVYLRQLRTTIEPKRRSGYPWLVSLTSETDKATKYIFPLAQFLRFSSDARHQPYREPDWSQYEPGKPMAASHVEVPQIIYARNTPGHNPYMRDCRLVIATNSPADLANLQNENINPDKVIEYSFRNTAKDYWNYILLKGEHGVSSYGYFQPTRPDEARHPLFYVATVDPLIMDGHGLPFAEGFRRDNFVATILSLLVHSRVRYATNTPGTVELRAEQHAQSKSSGK
jgi:hypothetical protein